MHHYGIGDMKVEHGLHVSKIKGKKSVMNVMFIREMSWICNTNL